MKSGVLIAHDAVGVQARLLRTSAQSTEWIDGIVAAIRAPGRAMVREDEGSVYETRGLTIV